ncbi:hypothetical protein BJX96DRAFT_156940 [Aspergillus floccosus]
MKLLTTQTGQQLAPFVIAPSSAVMSCFDTRELANKRALGHSRQESPAGNAKRATHVPWLA